MKKSYIAPYCLFEAIDSEEMIMSSIFDNEVSTAAGDSDETIDLPGTSSGGQEPGPVQPGGPIEAGAKGNNIFFNCEW